MRATLARPSFSLAGTPSICLCVSHVTRHGMSWRCKVARSRASKRRGQRCTVSSWEVFPAWRWDEVRHINCFDCVKTAQFLCARGALAKGRSCVKLLRPGQSRAAAISVSWGRCPAWEFGPTRTPRMTHLGASPFEHGATSQACRVHVSMLLQASAQVQGHLDRTTRPCESYLTCFIPAIESASEAQVLPSIGQGGVYVHEPRSSLRNASVRSS